MEHKTLPVSLTPNVVITAISGDLRLAGWDRAEMMARTDGNSLQISADTDPIVISCDEDLILYLPRRANVKVDNVAGDAILQALKGSVALGPVAGDLTINDLGPVMLGSISGNASLRNVGTLTAETVSGDFTLRGGHGICAVDKVGGDGSVRDVDGMLTIENVGSDLYVRNVHGAVTVKAGADVVFYVSPIPGQIYDVTAGDDLIVRLPSDANINLHLLAGSPESIQVDFPGVTLPEECNPCEVTLGEQTESMAEMLLTAGSDLVVTNRADSWESAAAFDSGDWHIPPIPPITPLPADFSERVNRRLQASMEHVQAHLEAANRQSDAKVQAAMRRAERKAHAAEVRYQRHAQVNVNVGRWNWDLSPSSPTEESDPVSDDERLVILHMLQEKKISLAEAEKLLATLEGK
jgi:hypothetical protein